MDLQQDWAKALSATTSRNLSSSSSAFFSANQSPFFSPRSPTFQGSELAKPDNPDPSSSSIANVDHIGSSNSIVRPENLSDVGFLSAVSPPASHNGDCKVPKLHNHVSSSVADRNKQSSSYNHASGTGCSGQKEKPRKLSRSRSYKKFSLARNLATYSSRRLRSYDVYIGFHGRKPSLLRFANWLRAELEVQGISCLASDRARCRNSRSHDIVEKAMNASTIGVIILTKRSFGNPYTVEEMRNFLGKKNLVPIFFDMGPADCLARDIIEMRGELWEKHGGQLWMLYGGLEKEWKEAVEGLSRMDEGKLEAQDGNWRDCITKAVLLLATRLGRRSVVEKVNRWKERVEKEEFSFPRNENFIGRKKELSELELMLFGNVSGDAEQEYFELKTRHRRKSLVLGWSENRSVEERVRDHQVESSSSKGKEPVIWRESEREIEMQRADSPHGQHQSLGSKHGGRFRRRKRSGKILYGKGIACVSGDSGIGKTELLLEYAYRFSQRYKMVLWIGGESRYFRQNYLNLWPFLDVDVGIENQYLHRGKTNSFEEQEDAAVSRIRKELMRDIPFLVVIDNLESEKDWWDKKYIMDLLPRFGGDTHFIISTRLPRIMNLESLKLSYLSGVEAMSLMKGIREYPIAEIDALSTIEEKLGRLTLGLGIVGAILSELPINPTRLLDTVNRMPPQEFIWSSKESPILRQNNFLLQLLEVCFSIFDHADGPRSLATRMAQVSGWFGPGAIPISLLAVAANKVPQKHQGSTKFWKMCWHTLTCGLMQSHSKRSEIEAASMLVRFGIARSRTKEDHIHFHDIVQLYSCKRGAPVVAQAAVQAVSYRGFTSLHLEHLWAACFLVFGFGTNSVAVELTVPELLVLVKRVVLPLAIHTFITFSRCNAALELLRVCTDALEAAEESLVSRVEKWLNKPYCWGSAKSEAQLNPYLWQELAMLRAAVLETRAKLMLKGGHYDIADDLIRKTVHVRASIYGEHHPDTISARETQAKVTRLLTNKEGS